MVSTDHLSAGSLYVVISSRGSLVEDYKMTCLFV